MGGGHEVLLQRPMLLTRLFYVIQYMLVALSNQVSGAIASAETLKPTLTPAENPTIAERVPSVIPLIM